MNFDLSDEQREIKDTAKQFFADRFKPEKVRELAEARSYDDGLDEADGRAGLARDRDLRGRRRSGPRADRAGGAAGGVGVRLRPGPLLGSAGAALVISAAGSDEQRAEWLPKLASGEATGAFGGVGPDGESTLFCDLPTADVAVVFDGEGALLAPASRARLRAGRDDRRHPLLRDGLRPGRRPPARATSTPAATGSRSRSPPS